MNFEGIVLGAVCFLVIGLFHPLVIKGEYYLGRKCIPAFAVAGVICIGLSLMLDNTYTSVVLGIVGFSSFWSIKEVFEQEERVKKGWFPANPKRKNEPVNET